MSKIEDIVRLSPPVAAYFKKDEQLVSKGHCCPECKGRGWYWDMDFSGMSEAKEPCSVCNGTGMVDAVITIQWKASEEASKI